MFRALFYLLVLIGIFWGVHRYWESGELPFVGGSVEDATNLASVKAALALHRDLSERPISVRTREGVVTLTGEVASDEEKREADVLVASIDGIQRIENLMTVNPALGERNVGDGLSLGQRIDDVSLAAKVRTALKLDGNVQDTDIAIHVRDGNVTLEGAVDSKEQAELAASRTRAVKGVKSVENRIDVDGVSLPAKEAAEAIGQELAENENLADYELRAVVRDGSVVVQGRVRTGAERELAELLARRAAPGADIVNEIRTSR